MGCVSLKRDKNGPPAGACYQISGLSPDQPLGQGRLGRPAHFGGDLRRAQPAHGPSREAKRTCGSRAGWQHKKISVSWSAGGCGLLAVAPPPAGLERSEPTQYRNATLTILAWLLTLVSMN